jgi:hypothetical protein
MVQTRWLIAAVLGLGVLLVTSFAAAAPQMQYVWGGTGGTVVFIHGKSDCSTYMTDCNSATAYTGPIGYWTNDGESSRNLLLDEATRNYTSGSNYTRYEAFAIGYDLDNQAIWNAANDVGGCLQDLYQGTNSSGCNPSGYQRTQFIVVTHSAGGTVIDRLLSTGWFSGAPAGGNYWSRHIKWVISIAPTLAGSRSASALYGQGYGNFCTTLVSWAGGFGLKDTGAASLTRSSITGSGNQGNYGRSPVNLYKVPSTGGSCSADNNCGDFTCSFFEGCGASVNEHDNDTNMGALATCEGYSSSDDMDGLVYWSDADPTNNTSANGCNTTDTAYGSGHTSCIYYSQFTGAYIHWFTTWANHSHSRDDAYTYQYGIQSTGGCMYYSPGTCVGQYGLL